MELDCKNEDIWNKKGILFIAIEKFDDALVCFDKALEINNRNINFYINKSNALFNLNRLDESLEVINVAFLLNDNCKKIALVKVKILKKLGRYEEAELLEKESKNMSEIEDMPLIYKKLIF